MMVGLKRISAAFGLMAASAAPTLAQIPNQATADAVATTLRSSNSLSAHRIDVEAREGLVTLSGAVATPAQHAEAIGRARQVEGVTAVVDRLRVSGDSRVVPAAFQAGAPSMPGVPPQVALGGHMSGGHGHGGGAYAGDAGMMGGGAYAGDAGMMGGGMVADGGMIADGPMPEGMAGMPGASQTAMPGNPNYAWPSYAPFPNFSAVGYPTSYPWQAWPNIGPFYPYPEVPLDWRAVTLRWDDGIWWLDFKKHYTRPFFTPYPFGLFAY